MHSRPTALDAMGDRRDGGQPRSTRGTGSLPWRSLGLPLFGALALFAVACDEPTRPRIPSQQPLVVTASATSVQVPRTVQAFANGGDGTTMWESSDQTVADVSTSGLVTARFPGAVTITASRGNRSATLELRVTATRLEIGPNPASVAVSGTRSLTAIVRDADDAVLERVPVRWSTASGSVATVDATGLVTGVATGFATISAAGGGVAGSIRVMVGTPDNPFAGIAFSRIGTVGNYACGLEAPTGFAYCWGDGHGGALGNGDGDVPDGPHRVSGANRFLDLSVGYYGNCAIEAESLSAYCWGANRFGSAGDGTLTIRSVPTLVSGGNVRFSGISTSGELTCGVEAETGFGYCWGREGRIGDGTLEQRSVPTLVGSGGVGIRFSSITVGGHACGIEAETARAYCWGPNESGQLGDGTTTARLTPVLVAGGELRFTSISPGAAFTCGVEAQTGAAYCWGANALGQLGDGTTTPRLDPKMVAGGGLRFATVSSNWDMSCGLEAETGVGYCWGSTYPGPPRLTPTMVDSDGIRFSNISVGGDACAVEAVTGRGYCWGASLVPTLLAFGTFGTFGTSAAR